MRRGVGRNCVLFASRRRKKLRAIQGLLYDAAVKKNGLFSDDEADEIVDAHIQYHERPGHHPLQTAVISGIASYSSGRQFSIKSSVLFSQPTIRAALKS